MQKVAKTLPAAFFCKSFWKKRLQAHRCLLSNVIRFYGHAMQGLMGGYLEKNVQTMQDLQSKMADQSQGLTPEAWTQFMSMQAPMMQSLVAQNLEQSKNLYQQMQEQMQKQAAQMLETMGLKR